MVSSPPEYSTSVDFVSGYRSRYHNLVSARVQVQEDDSFDSDSVSSSVFEFHKTIERVPHKSPFPPPFSKLAPSKWDDAQKWIGSPTSNRSSKGGGGLQPKKSSLGGYGNRSFGSKVVLEVTDAVDTKRIDLSQAKKDIGEQKAVNRVPESSPVVVSNKPSSLFENPFADSASEHFPLLNYVVLKRDVSFVITNYVYNRYMLAAFILITSMNDRVVR